MLDVSQSIVPDHDTLSHMTGDHSGNAELSRQRSASDVLCGQWPLNWEGWSIHHVCNDFSQSSLITSQSYTGLQSKLYDAK